MNDMESRKFEDAFKQAFEEASVSPSDNVWTNIERSMDDMESRKFGGAFLQAFDDAGVRPSENVWTNIELDLMRAEGGKMKRRLVFYQLLAAASIAFALSIAGVGYYILKDQSLTGAGGQLAYQQETTDTNTPAENTTTATSADGTQGTIPSGTRSALRTDEQPAEQGAPVSTAQADAANQEQSQNTDAHAASSLTLTGKTPGIATTTPNNEDGTRYVAGAARPHKTTAGENTDTLTTQSAIAQRAESETQHAGASLEKQRYRASDGRNVGSSTVRANQTNQGQTAGNHQTSIAANDGGTTSNSDINSNAGQRQTLTGVTTRSKTSNDPLTAQGGHDEAGQQQLEGTQQMAGVTTTTGRVETATSGTRTKSSGSVGQDNVRLAQADETAGTRGATVTAGAGQQYADTHHNKATTTDATTTSGVTIPHAGQQTESMLAYSPVPSQATPVVTSLGTRVQKPASMKVEPAATVDPLVALLARLDEQEKNADTKNKKDKLDEEDFAPEKLWTSVGFAAGSFNTVNSSVSGSSGGGSMMIADARKDAVDKVANQQAKASGSSYSVGVSLGTRISSRWVLQGGVNYMTQASDYTASAVGTADYENFQAPSVNSIMSADKQSSSAEYALSNVVPTAPYNVNNSLQFVSVPVQAGYLLVNRKVGVQLNGGLSTDLFIQNTITPDGENLEKETRGSGSDSPYRTVNFSGLVGTELTYRFSKHYRLALNPGLRYPLNSIYKSDQPVTATPLTFDIGLRFRYIFH